MSLIRCTKYHNHFSKVTVALTIAASQMNFNVQMASLVSLKPGSAIRMMTVVMDQMKE